MKFTNLIVVTFLSLLSVTSEKTFSTNNDTQLIPKLNTLEDLKQWSEEVEQAVIDITNSNNSTTRTSIDLNTKLETVISGLFAEASAELRCQACKVGVGATARVTRLPFTKAPTLYAIEKLCKLASSQPTSVCHGLSQSIGELAYNVFQKMDLNDPNTVPVTCYALGTLCPMPTIKTAPLNLPAKPVPSTKVKSKGLTKFIVQITDLHYDVEYVEGAEASCKKVICCQKDSNSDEKDPNAVKRPANKWGDYRCDNSKLMTESILKAVADLNEKMKFDMVLFTGDIPAHDGWKETVEKAKNTEMLSYRMVDSALDPKKNRLYPSLGNHESVPLNAYPIDGKLGSEDFFVYKFAADQWRNWLPSKALQTVSNSGYYSVQHNPNLKVIALNNNLCYKLNLYLLLDVSNGDPNGMLNWLIKELDQAEKAGTKVYITSHVPPSATDCYQHFSENFHQIVERYSHIITGQFYGHLHYDEFSVFYNNTKKESTTAISNSYIAPSMTTYNGMNPGFRVYEVDSETYEVVDFIQYYADLTKSNTWSKAPNFQILYSARNHYGNSISKEKLRVLSPQFWHNVTLDLEKDSNKFDSYYNFRTKNAKTQKPCDDKCKQKLVCALRAGKSKDNCNEFSFSDIPKH